MKFKNKIIYAVLIILLVNTNYVFAEKSDSIKNEIEDNKSKIESLKDEKYNLNNEIQDKKDEINDLEDNITEKENELYALQLEISEYQKQIDNMQSEISELINSINESKLEVENKENYIIELKEEESRIKELLDARVRSVYKVDLSKQYIYMLIRSKNIFEIFQNLDNINQIINFDKKLIKSYKENQQIISDEIAQIELKITEQEEAQAVIEDKQSGIIEVKNKVVAIQKEEESKKNELLAIQREKQNNIVALENDSEKINSEIAELESHNEELEAELDRIINNVSGSNGSNDVDNNLQTESGFLRPISGRITSYYGYRINPVTGEYKLHKGIDYAGNYGDPIKASKSGVVEYSGWITGYGNTIILGHGNGVQTLYPHAQTLEVDYGDTVKQGDVIATVGSTGNSTGPHLHFEIRINGEAVDPLNYIPY
ncbi:M23 family metallopeptidase [Clostridium sp. 1001271B_151109_B4]|uniref:murein hydrolase activator EnvC family protein n=1 Tax=Clostridium sp. 1001271B_151109_B4 TaxID=2787148 RepID=UPI0018AB8080|nr:M23 family metallopeptidase [Clostridium sp. 1001271B_151109_B4]